MSIRLHSSDEMASCLLAGKMYYWDSYWTVRGLLACDMIDAARYMLDNLVWLVDTLGFVPNGARSYYINRSQPPMLTLIAEAYVNRYA
jgi:alpha,alpha-trehalase